MNEKLVVTIPANLAVQNQPPCGYPYANASNAAGQRDLSEPARRKHLRRVALRFHPAYRMSLALLLLR